MNIYYVYSYLREKDSTHGLLGSPYYIGKGKNSRAYNKSNGIRPSKDKSNIKILHKNLSESQAFKYEKQLIKKFGRIDTGTGCLRNRTDGGEGCCGVKFSDKKRKEISVRYSGSKNPNFGKKHSAEICNVISDCTAKRNTNRKWYNNGIENKFCLISPIGYSRGRLHQKPSTKGYKWYNNGIIQLSCKEKPIGDNWINGMLPKRILGQD